MIIDPTEMNRLKGVPAEEAIEDEFNGDNPKLISCIEALIRLNDSDSLIPHGIGGHARIMLSAAAVRLASAEPPNATDKLSAFLDALEEWGCEDNEKRAEEILAFQRGGYDLTAYAEDRE